MILNNPYKQYMAETGQKTPHMVNEESPTGYRKKEKILSFDKLRAAAGGSLSPAKSNRNHRGSISTKSNDKKRERPATRALRIKQDYNIA